MKKKLKEKKITIRMSKRFAALLYSTADKLDLSVAELVRAALENYLCELQTGQVRPGFLATLVKSKDGQLERVISEAIRRYAKSQGELKELESREPTPAESAIRISGKEG